MSLKDLLPAGTYEELSQKAHHQPKKDSESKLMVTCPQCGRKIEYRKDNPYRPFCSERCRLLDLGAWAADERRIAGDPLDSDLESDCWSESNPPVKPQH